MARQRFDEKRNPEVLEQANHEREVRDAMKVGCQIMTVNSQK
jgi:hypothetical protein